MKQVKTKTVALITLLLISISLVACQGSGTSEEATQEVQPTSPALEPVEATESISEALLEMAKQDLAQLLGISIDQITVASVTPQAADAGTYTIQLQSDSGEMYEYHTQGNSVVLVSEPLPTAPTATAETAVPAAVPIDTVTITMMNDTHIQVTVAGNLLQGCDILNEPVINQEGQTFVITLTRNERIQQPCTDALVPFEEMIELDAADLPAGEYTVIVNDVSQTFILGEETTALTPEQITFTVAGLASVMITETIPVAEITADTPFWAIHPEHVQFTFEDYILTDALQQAQLRVYPTSAYEMMNETAAVEIERLRALLTERPETIPDPAPFLPLVNANQVIWARADYLDFQSGSGIRYLTQYAQALVPVNNQELLYTFQGLTEDEAFYVSAVFPVNHPDLPVNAGDIPADFEESLDTYLADMIAQLDEADAAAFTPDLAILDAIVQSIAIASDAVHIQDAATLMTELQAAGATVTETHEETLPYFPLPAKFWQVNGGEVQVIELESEQQQEAAAALIQDNGYTINHTAVDWPDTPHFWATGQLIVLYVGTDEAVLTVLNDTLGKPITSETSILEGDYPAAVTTAVALFSQDTGIRESDIEIVSVAENEWPSGCLGLEEEGEVCTLVIVPGFQIIVQAEGSEYEIRSDDVGAVMRWQLLTESASNP